ncbi:SacI homology domain-containing protein [Gongronella butleri]|nr:SacI homology domain-containing protein [Gongronella butleri]
MPLRSNLSPEKRVLLYIQDDSFFIAKQSTFAQLDHDGSLHRVGKAAFTKCAFFFLSSYFPRSIDQLPSWLNDTKPYEIGAVIGLVQGFLNKYLVVATDTQNRGELFGHTVSSLEKVVCLPLEATAARKLLGVQKVDDSEIEDASLSNSFIGLGMSDANADPVTDALSPAPASPPRASSSPSFFDRFKKTFDKTPPDNTLHPPSGISSSPPPRPASASSSKSTSNRLAASTDSIPTDTEIPALEKRLLREIASLFGRSMFLFAHNYDITNSFERAHNTKAAGKQGIDHRFWWNEHISQPFRAANLADLVITAVQGTFQLEECVIDGFPFTFGLISRRSRERAGLRYQRRGVNSDGQVANFVETEQFVFFQRDQVHHVASFVQTRGSIPLFWSQSPYTLHPDPVLHRSDEENLQAIEKHFQQQEACYGKQVIVNLTELSGREAIIGSEYRHYIEDMADPEIKYIEFDFHHETKGMRYENINKLSESLRDTMDKMAYFWADDHDTVFCQQSGVFRTNCMDCLDRTNVVQCAFARYILNLQLMRFGISEYPDKGIKYYGDFERVFNNVWANNGDMISRMYTGTSALKGDFTRTGKRNIVSLVNDASNSLARMYFNTVKDFWRQATVDYVLGYHKLEIFKNVPSSQQRTEEPGMDSWLNKIRQDAIDVSAQIVIADDETLKHGWTLLVPKETASGKELLKRFEEKVVLLTTKALYVCSYNYQLEKVMQFKRIDLATIESIRAGEYILSTLSAETRNPDLHYGFRIFYNEHGLLMRWNTGSLVNKNLHDLSMQPFPVNDDDDDDDASSVLSADSAASDSSSEPPMDASMAALYRDMDHITFKAVPRYTAASEDTDRVVNARQHIEAIVQIIMEQCKKSEQAKFLNYSPIISLQQAEKSDSILKKVGYKLKHAIWV